MTLSANQAAKEAGIAKKTLLEAIKNGRMSADKNDKGHWQIDPSELFRVFPRTGSELVAKTATHPPQKPHETSALEIELKFIRERLADKEAEIEDLKGQRDDWRDQAKTLLIANQSKPDGQGGQRRFFGLLPARSA